MFNWFLNYLEKKGRKLTIYDREDKLPYLNRYYILFPDSVKRERTDIPFNVFLHQFMKSDDDYAWHDHPWDWYFTLILKGGYWEHTPAGTKWRGPGTFKFIKMKTRHFDDFQPENGLGPSNDAHWLEVPNPGKTWTLFIRGRKNREWGFIEFKTKKWTQWKQFLAMKTAKVDNE